MSSLDLQAIEKIAKLSQLSFTKEGLANYQHDLNEMLEMIEAIKNVDTQNIEPLTSPHSMSLRTRHDVVTEIVDEAQQGALQKLAPEIESKLFLVTKVIDDHN